MSLTFNSVCSFYIIVITDIIAEHQKVRQHSGSSRTYSSWRVSGIRTHQYYCTPCHCVLICVPLLYEGITIIGWSALLREKSLCSCMLYVREQFAMSLHLLPFQCIYIYIHIGFFIKLFHACNIYIYIGFVIIYVFIYYCQYVLPFWSILSICILLNPIMTFQNICIINR